MVRFREVAAAGARVRQTAAHLRHALVRDRVLRRECEGD
jgi:hypothetical protein